MTIKVWPEHFPFAPIAGSVSVSEPYPAAMVTEVEDGPELVRARANTLLKKLPYRLPVKSGLIAEVIDFLDHDLQRGTAHFLFRVRLPGQGYVQRRCYLDQANYRANPLGADEWALEFTLVVFPAA